MAAGVSLSLVVLIATFSIVGGATTYGISVDNGIDTPTKTVTLEGKSFQVSGIAEVANGETLPVSVTAPDDESYRVYIYDSDKQIVDQQYQSGGDSLSFDIDGYHPGTYSLALHMNGDYQAVYPFVVKGADVSVDAPSTVEVGEDVTASATVEQTSEDVSITGVEMVFFGNDVTERETASGSNGDYEVTFDTDEVPAGDYRIYAVVSNDSTTANDETEIIAVSGENAVTLQDSSSETSTSTGNSGSQPGASTTTSTVGTTTIDNTTTVGPTSSPQPTTIETNQTTLPGTTTGSTSQLGDSPTTIETTSGVITPNSPNTETTTTSTPAFPFTVIGAMVALLLLFRFR